MNKLLRKLAIRNFIISQIGGMLKFIDRMLYERTHTFYKNILFQCICRFKCRHSDK